MRRLVVGGGAGLALLVAVGCAPPTITVDDGASSPDGMDRRKDVVARPKTGQKASISFDCPEGFGAARVQISLRSQTLRMRYMCAVPVPSQGDDGAGVPAERIAFGGDIPKSDAGTANRIECQPRMGMNKIDITLNDSDYEGTVECVGRDD